MLANLILFAFYFLLLLYSVFSIRTSVSLICYCASSIVLFLVYYLYNAFDVGLTEISIGSFLAFFYFYTTYAKVGQKVYESFNGNKFQIAIASIFCVLLFCILLYTGLLLEEVSLNVEYSAQYLATYPQTHISNIITAILASFRGFDTMGETLIIAVSSLAVAGILHSTKFDSHQQKI